MIPIVRKRAGPNGKSSSSVGNFRGADDQGMSCKSTMLWTAWKHCRSLEMMLGE
jgi:hypothetical protein